MKNVSDLLKKYETQLLEREETASKSDYGKLLIIGGSFGMSGAAYLSGLAAFRSGIGMVRFYGPECNRQILQTLLPEAMYTADRIASEEDTRDFANEQADQEAMAKGPLHCDMEQLAKALDWADYVVCGPGLSQSAYAKDIVAALFKADLSSKRLVLLDADALNIISTEKFNIRELSIDRSRKGYADNVVITPHIGEMSRLTGKTAGTLKKAPAAAAKEYAVQNRCTVVLKDAVSYIAEAKGTVYRNTSGSPALAKAGSGDVLTGVIAGITAVIGGNSRDGAVLGTFFHGKAGEIAGLYQGMHSTLARDIADAMGAVIGSFNYKYEGLYDMIDEALTEYEPYQDFESFPFDEDPGEGKDQNSESKPIRFKDRKGKKK